MSKTRDCISCCYCITRVSKQGQQLKDSCVLTGRVVEHGAGSEPKDQECILNEYKVQGYL